MVFQFVIGKYNSDGSVTAYVRSDKGERDEFKILGFPPYFYVDSKTAVPEHPKLREINSGFKAVYGEDLTKLTMQDPTDVGGTKGAGGFRDQFEHHWEADIDFIRRLLIDSGIKSGFDVLTKRKVVNWRDLVPAEFSLPPLESFLDIETYSSDRIPNPLSPTHKITCATMWDNKLRQYATVLLDDKEDKTVMGENWTVYHVMAEAKLVLLVRRYLMSLMPDIGAEWNTFDFEYLESRGKRLNVEDWSVLRKMCLFDMLQGYEKIYKKGSNRLKDVALDEELTDELEPEVDYAQMWEKDRMGLAARNKRHVEWMVKLNQKKANGDLVRFYWNLKNYAGLEDLKGTLYHGVMVDTLLLRKYHGKYVLPSKPPRGLERESKLGGLVGVPPKALVEDVVVYDFSRYYPNLMIGLLSAMNEDWVKPIIDLCVELMEERDKYDKILSSLKIDTDEYNASKSTRDSVKYIGEAVIGYFGSEASRLYNKRIFEMVTSMGQKGIKFLEKTAKDLGYDVIYYDTDALFVPVKGWKNISALRDELNEATKAFCRGEGIKRDITLKIDRIADRAIFTGVAKRYCLHVIWEDGKDVDYLYIKGYEHVRRDASLITRMVQKEVFDAILRKGVGGLTEYLRDIVRKMKGGEFSLREVAIPKTLGKRFEGYKSRVDYLRGTLYANRYLNAGIKPGDQVRMIYVKRVPGHPNTDVLCFLDETTVPAGTLIDFDKMIDRTVKGKVDEFLGLVGLGWERVMGARSLMEAFG